MAKPPEKKPTQSSRTRPKQRAKGSQPDTFFDDFFQNNAPSPADEEAEPEQQRQWISDQLMWETTLGLREDDAIKRVITPGDDAAPNQRPASHTTSPPKKALSEQERKLLRTQLIDVDDHPSAPTPSRKQAETNKTAPPKRHTTHTTAPKSTTPRPRPNPGVTESKAPVQKAPLPPKHQTSSPGARAQQPNTAKPKPGANSLNTQVKPVPQRSAAPQTPPRVKSPIPQSSPATKREADLSLEEQIEFDIDENVVWDKYFQFVKQGLLMLSIALVSFTAGYYLGGTHTPPVQSAKSDKKAPQVKTSKADLHKNKPAPKKPKPKVAPTKETVRTSANANQHRESAATSANVFQGKEIDIEALDQPSTTTDPQDETHPDTSLTGEQHATNFISAPQSAGQTTTTDTATFTGSPTPATDSIESNTPQPADNENNLQTQLDQSLQLFQNNQWQALLELSDKILATNPGVVTALTNRAAANTELGFYDRALADCNLAIKIEPDDPLAINNRGYVYEKMGDLANAIADYEKACALDVELSCQEAQRLKSNNP